MAKDILVIIEHEDGKIRRGSLEALALARKLGRDLDLRPVAAILGCGVQALAEDVARSGADEVFQIEDELLRGFTPGAFGTALHTLLEKVQPEWVLMSHSYQAQDLLPLISARFGAPVISDAAGVEIEDGEPVFLRQPYDAKLVARTVDRGPAPRFATLQAGAFPSDDLPKNHEGRVAAQDANLDESVIKRREVKIRAATGKTVDLSSSDIVVAGGRGFGDKEKFEALVGEFAKVLGAGMGASRPVIDNDWLPHEHQIGSSGQTVSPRLYFALAISGAIQHVVGIRGAQVIVAVNKDKDAPIFNEATYGIVGDVHEILPELTKIAQEMKEN